MVKGNRVTTSRRFVEEGRPIPELSPGDLVRVVEEEGDTYLAQVDGIKDDLVDLTVYWDSTPETDAILQDPVWRKRLTKSLEELRNGQTRPLDEYWAESDVEDKIE